MNIKLNSLRAAFVALVMGCSVNSVSAAEVVHPQTLNFLLKDQIGQNWTFIENINGINVSYSVIELDDKRFLSIQFENSNTQALDFIWSMTKNDSPVMITSDEMNEARIHLDAHASEQFDGSYIIELGADDAFSAYATSITIINPIER